MWYVGMHDPSLCTWLSDVVESCVTLSCSRTVLQCMRSTPCTQLRRSQCADHSVLHSHTTVNNGACTCCHCCYHHRLHQSRPHTGTWPVGAAGAAVGAAGVCCAWPRPSSPPPVAHQAGRAAAGPGRYKLLQQTSGCSDAASDDGQLAAVVGPAGVLLPVTVLMVRGEAFGTV